MKIRICLLLILLLAPVVLLVTPVHADLATYQQNCPYGSISIDCQAPTLTDIQTFGMNMLGTAWALGGVLFFGILIYNGLIYLLGNWEESKYILGASLEDVQKRMTQWGIGFVIFFLSYPIMNSGLKLVVGDSACYKDLQTPAVHFIFPCVCDYEGDGIHDCATPTPTPTPGNPTPTNPTPAIPTPQLTPPASYNISCTTYDADISWVVDKLSRTYCPKDCTSILRGVQKFPFSDLYANQLGIKYIWCQCDDNSCLGFTAN